MPVMTRDDIVALLGRRQMAWNARNAAALAALHAPDGVVASPTGGVLEGRPEIERIYRLWLSAFPDLVMEPEEVVIEGSRVVQVVRITGRHDGDFFGIAPTGRHVEAQMASFMTVADGLIAEERRIFDFTGVLLQVGVLKAKPA
jgi:uncharacterized protein (TIGR02246 family)